MTRFEDWDLQDAKRVLESVENGFQGSSWEVVAADDVGKRRLTLGLTDRFVRAARKARLWKSKEMLSALKNVRYGFDRDRPRSRGGADGIFLVDRNYTPKNRMIRKLYDRYIDKSGSGFEDLRSAIGEEYPFHGVRLVSHHLRLLGVLFERAGEDVLILVDLDRD